MMPQTCRDASTQITELRGRNAKLVEDIRLLEQKLELAEWERGRSDEDRMLLHERNAKLVAALYIAKAAILTRREDSEAIQSNQ